MAFESSLQRTGGRDIDRYNLDFSMRKFFKSTPGRMLLALSITLVAAALLVLVSLYNPILPGTLYGWFSAAWIGLTAGLSARLLLGDRSFLTRILIALPALMLGFFTFLVGLVLLSLLTPTTAGIDLSGTDTTEVGFQWSSPRRFGALFVLLSSWAWRRGGKPGRRIRVKSSGSSSKARPRLKKSPAAKKKSKTRVRSKGSTAKAKRTNSSRSSNKTKIKTIKKPTRTRTASKPASRAKTVKPRPARPAAVRRDFWVARFAGLRSATRDILKGGAKNRKRASSSASLLVRPGDPKKLSRRKRIKGQTVNISSVVEHRCPYCLEEVLVNDPRGVRICPVCGTRHHRDCWNVTGTCQVPHE